MLPGVGDGADALDGVIAGAGVHLDEVRASDRDPETNTFNLTPQTPFHVT